MLQKTHSSSSCEVQTPAWYHRSCANCDHRLEASRLPIRSTSCTHPRPKCARATSAMNRWCRLAAISPRLQHETATCRARFAAQATRHARRLRDTCRCTCHTHDPITPDRSCLRLGMLEHVLGILAQFLPLAGAETPCHVRSATVAAINQQLVSAIVRRQ